MWHPPNVKLVAHPPACLREHSNWEYSATLQIHPRRIRRILWRNVSLLRSSLGRTSLVQRPSRYHGRGAVAGTKHSMKKVFPSFQGPFLVRLRGVLVALLAFAFFGQFLKFPVLNAEEILVRTVFKLGFLVSDFRLGACFGNSILFNTACL